MGWQEILTLAIVAFTAVLLVRSEILRRQSGKGGSCGNCNCGVAGKTNNSFDV